MLLEAIRECCIRVLCSPIFGEPQRHGEVASFRHNSESVRFGFRLVRGCVYVALSYYATRRDHKGLGQRAGLSVHLSSIFDSFFTTREDECCMQEEIFRYGHLLIFGRI